MSEFTNSGSGSCNSGSHPVTTGQSLSNLMGFATRHGSAGSSARIRLSVAIMTHPARKTAAEALRRQLGDVEAEVVVDPNPCGKTLPTARLAWAATKDEATHHIVLQDDVLPCKRFIDRVMDAVRHRPDCAVALMANWGARTANLSRAAAISGSRWVEVVDYYLPTCGLVLPADLGRKFGAARFTDRPVDEEVPDDVAMLHHASSTRTQAYVHVPSLLQHDELPSVVGNGSNGQRPAVCFADHMPDSETDASTVGGGFLVIPHFSWSRRQNNWLARRTQHAREWFKVTPVEVLTSHGVDVQGLRRDYFSALRTTGIAAVETTPWAWDLWLTAVAIGMLAAADENHVDLDSALAQDAMRSLGPAALRLMMSAEDLRAIEPALTAFSTLGASTGIWWTRQPGVNRFGRTSLDDRFYRHAQLPSKFRLPAGFGGRGWNARMASA